MGLSIHYSGRFNPNASLEAMIEEVTDIANIFKWPCHVYNSCFTGSHFDVIHNNQIYGVCFTPPGCETISLCFLSNGRMSSAAQLNFFGDASEDNAEIVLYTLSPKTQFAGVAVHIVIIKLLKYLSGKYFLNFKLSDEGKYWETGDEKVLEQIFRQYNRFLDEVSHALQNFPMQGGETFEDYFERILKGRNKK